MWHAHSVISQCPRYDLFLERFEERFLRFLSLSLSLSLVSHLSTTYNFFFHHAAATEARSHGYTELADALDANKPLSRVGSREGLNAIGGLQLVPKRRGVCTEFQTSKFISWGDISPKYSTSAEMTARMCSAAASGELHEIAKLIAAGVPSGSADYDKRTPLHIASSEGQDEAVALLLSSGAHANASDRWGGTPLADAVKHGHDGICAILRDAGALLCIEECELATMLCDLGAWTTYFICEGNVDMVPCAYDDYILLFFFQKMCYESLSLTLHNVFASFLCSKI